jgi:hypothetical protein
LKNYSERADWHVTETYINKDRPETLPSLISKLAIGHDPESVTSPPVLIAYFPNMSHDVTLQLLLGCPRDRFQKVTP